MKNQLNRILRKFGAEIHGAGYIQAQLKKDFQQDSFSVQKELLGTGKISVIFDIGANRGDIVERYTTRFPQAVIHAFEPFPGSFDQLKSRFSNNEKVICHALAVGEEKKTLPFYVNKNVDTNSLLKPIKMGLSSDASVQNETLIEVPCVRLDDFCEMEKIEQIHILKMDIQGGEYGALKGAQKLLEAKRVKLLYLETYFLEQYENQPLFHDISKLLHGFGYYLQDIYHPIYGKGSIAWGDVIFLPRN